jgi:hypothetical protein
MTEDPYRLARDVRGISFRSADALSGRKRRGRQSARQCTGPSGKGLPQLLEHGRSAPRGASGVWRDCVSAELISVLVHFSASSRSRRCRESSPRLCSAPRCRSSHAEFWPTTIRTRSLRSDAASRLVSLGFTKSASLWRLPGLPLNTRTPSGNTKLPCNLRASLPTRLAHAPSSRMRGGPLGHAGPHA